MPDTTTTPAATTNLADHEFDIACEAAPHCDEPAAWYVWLSHTMASCGTTAPVCDRHKAIIDAWWAKELALATGHCLRCHEHISPNLRDNVEWVPLKADRHA